jgi:hypothetical protein
MLQAALMAAIIVLPRALGNNFLFSTQPPKVLSISGRPQNLSVPEFPEMPEFSIV